MERRNRIKEYIEEILTMGKFDEGQYSALVLAAAGLKRLKLEKEFVIGHR